MRSSSFWRLLFFRLRSILEKIWSKSKFWLRHTSWSQDIFKHKYKVHFLLFLLLSLALRFFFSFSSLFYLPMIRDIQIVFGEALMTHRGPRNVFWRENNFEQDFQSLKYFPQLFRYLNYTKIQQVIVFYHSLWKIWWKWTWETSLSV